MTNFDYATMFICLAGEVKSRKRVAEICAAMEGIWDCQVSYNNVVRALIARGQMSEWH